MKMIVKEQMEFRLEGKPEELFILAKIIGMDICTIFIN
jgi:hypothetical protein